MLLFGFQTGQEPETLLPRYPQCWAYKCGPLYLTLEHTSRLSKAIKVKYIPLRSTGARLGAVNNTYTLPGACTHHLLCSNSDNNGVSLA